MAVHDLHRAILMTIAYSAQFSYPLTVREIWVRLISPHTVSLTAVKTALEQLIKNGYLLQKQGYYYLRSYPLTPTLRVERKDNAFHKLIEADSFIELASKVPWILGIAVTGSVAVDNAKEDDDVDFLIFTQKNRLWLTRACIVLIALYKGKRRSWGREEKNSWCFNLWLEEDALTMPTRLRTVYGAYELCQTHWVYVKDVALQRKYYALNSWCKKYIPQYYHLVSRTFVTATFTNKSITFGGILFTLLNEIGYFLQRVYMVPHITKEKVARSYAFFHPRDTRQLIYTKWREILKTI